jgi:hypothetical protein
MASSLELGKLVTASFLYRKWNDINKFQKIYLTFATFLLVIITSAGIYGYLSNAYQRASLELEQKIIELDFVEENIGALIAEQNYLMGEMNSIIESYPDNYITARREVRGKYGGIIASFSERIFEAKLRLGDLKGEVLKIGTDVGPAMFIAKSLDVPMEAVVNIFIFALIFVFDPLAVMLIVAYNQLLMHRKFNT